MLSLNSTISVSEADRIVQLRATPIQVMSTLQPEIAELPGWLLLAMLSLKAAVLVILFLNGFGLIGLALCAISMSFLIGEREEFRRMREATLSREVGDARPPLDPEEVADFPRAG